VGTLVGLYTVYNREWEPQGCALLFTFSWEWGNLGVFNFDNTFYTSTLMEEQQQGERGHRYNGKTVRQEHMYVPRDMGWNCNELVGTECVHIFHHVLLFITPSLEWYLRKVCFTLRTFLDHDAVKWNLYFVLLLYSVRCQDALFSLTELSEMAQCGWGNVWCLAGIVGTSPNIVTLLS